MSWRRNVVVFIGVLNDKAPAGLIAATAIARFSAGENGSGLDNGRDGGCDAGRHVEVVVRTIDLIY
jgi:hypothetical protein